MYIHRSTFSPIFTSGKMKMMIHFINSVSQRLADEVASSANDQRVIDLKDLFGKFSMDTIATCAFGVEADSFGDKETVFVKNAKSIFTRYLVNASLKVYCAF